MNKRFLLIILGTAIDVEKDLNFIADAETGVNYVDGKGMFICTFYSSLSMAEVHEKLAHRPAMMIFDITDSENYGINLPSKYYTGIFPEIQKELDNMMEYQKQHTNWEPVASQTMGKVKEEVVVVEEYDSLNDILDKLSRNKYDRTCLTEKEIEVLNKG